MKKVKKLFLFVVFTLLSVLTLASCGEETPSNNTNSEVSESSKGNESSAIPSTGVPSTSTPSTSIPSTSIPSTSTSTALTDDQVKANFDTYAKSINLSKASINGVINSVVSSGSSVDPSVALGKINIPNTKFAGVTYLQDVEVRSQDIYLWQNQKVIYLGTTNINDYVIKFDLAQVEEMLNGLKSQIPTEDTDYVGMLLSLVELPEDFDIDTILSQITFVGDDFTYADGWFTLKNEKIVAIVANIMGADASDTSAMLSQYLSKLEIKIGFDGVNFTGFSVEFRPAVAEGAPTDFVEKNYGKLSLVINYEYGFAVGGEFNFELYAANEEEIVNDSLNIVVNALGITATARVKMNLGMAKIDATASFEANNNGAQFNIDGNVVVGNDQGNQTIIYSDPIPFSLDFNLTKTAMTLSVTYSEVEIVNVTAVLDNYAFVSVTITVDISMFVSYDDSDTEFDKIVMIVTVDDVTVPSTFTDGVADAQNGIELIMNIISSIINPNPDDSYEI